MRRIGGIAVLVALVASCVGGFAILLLPYDNTTNVAGFTGDVDVRCQAPLVDAASKEDAADGWFVTDRSNTGVTFTRGIEDDGDAAGGTITTGGSLCYPDSVRRAAVGVAFVTVGATFLLAWQLLRTRRRNRELDGEDADFEDEDAAGGTDGATAPG